MQRKRNERERREQALEAAEEAAATIHERLSATAITGEISRARIVPADRAGVRKFMAQFKGVGLEWPDPLGSVRPV